MLTSRHKEVLAQPAVPGLGLSKEQGKGPVTSAHDRHGSCRQCNVMWRPNPFQAPGLFCTAPCNARSLYVKEYYWDGSGRGDSGWEGGEGMGSCTPYSYHTLLRLTRENT